MTVPRITQILIHKSILLLIIQRVACLIIETDTISVGVVMKDSQTIVSPSQTFKLGFFSPPNTTNRYVGVFFTFSEETAIWVANRDTPLKDSSGGVALSRDGNLVVLDGSNKTVWSTNLTTSFVTNLVVQILDTGNLVLRKEAMGDALWESFSQPTDSLVKGMALTQNARTGKQVLLTSWKNDTDPGIGSFTLGLDAMSGLPQLVTWNDGRRNWRSGPWNGLIFLGMEGLIYIYPDNQVESDNFGNFFYTTPHLQFNGLTRMSLKPTRSAVWEVWDGVEKRWYMDKAYPAHECDVYGKCGAFGSCIYIEFPIFSCLRGFEPVNKEDWGRGNWSNGCRRKNQLQCGDHGFERLRYMKVPDFAQPSPSWVQDECRTRCMGNCSCIA